MMDYSKRIAIVTTEVQKLLNGYEPPRARADDPSWQKQEISDVSDAVNSSIPKDATETSIPRLFERMRRDLKKSAKTRAWPITREIVEAIKERTPKKDFEASQVAAFDSDTIAAMRINNGEGVAETYIIGSAADRLIEKNLVTPKTLDAYKYSIEQNKIPGDLDPVEENPF
jgi:hypothetical protein